MAETIMLAAANTAFAAQDGAARWTVGNHLIAKTVEWQEGRGLYLSSLIHRQTGHCWQPDRTAEDEMGAEFSLRWNGELLSARQATELHSVHAQSSVSAVTLQFNLRLAAALDVSLFYRAHTSAAVIEQWLEVAPIEAGTLGSVSPLVLSFSALPSPTVHWVRGLQGHGWHMPDSGPYPAYQLRSQPLTPAQPLHLESGLRSTWHEIAWLALGSAAAGPPPRGPHLREVPTSARWSGARWSGDEGLCAGLLYSGRWSARAAAAADEGGSLTLVSEGYATPLAPGTRWTSPAAFVGLYAGDLDAAAHLQHTYMRTVLLPPTPPDFPWVQYNTWFAHLVDIDETILRREAVLAAGLGCEVFVIDAGWWEPSRRTFDNFTTGLGAWQPSAEKFPSGLRAFADFVRSLGMRFGIWVEPERVDLRQPASWQLGWLARHHDAIISPPWPPDTVSGWLCYGNPAVQDWAIEWVSNLVASLGADWIKWDSNWWGVCTCADHGHDPSDGEFYQVQGVHNVLAELRRRFPDLIIENCAGGGTRTDFAMLTNTHVTWLHDASTPNHRVRFHMAGATYVFPPEVGNAFVIDDDDEPLTDPATARAALDTIARSRMLGAFGVSARLADWSDTALDAVRAAISQYKQLRPLLKTGRFYHLLPQAELQCPEIKPHGQWEAYAVVDPAAEGGALWVFRAEGGVETSPTHRLLRLAGLAPHRTYQLTDLDLAQTTAATGAALMEDGLSVDLRSRTSALVILAATGGEAAT